MESRVFFPWERRGGLSGLFGNSARVRFAFGLLLFFCLAVVVLRREEKLAAIRATRASITDAGRAVESFRADHGNVCPKDWREVVSAGFSRDIPIDAWGHPLRLICPGRKHASGFDLSSDGPDGIPGGLDRVE